MRIKSKWHNKGVKTIEEIAQTVAYIIWKIAHSSVDKIYMDGFNFNSNQQLLGVIGEFVALMLQMSAQITHKSMAPDQFTPFVETTARQLANIMADNLAADHANDRPAGQFADDARAFINHLNRRLSDYAEFRFTDGEPGYPALRFFGSAVEKQMQGGDKKWIAEQVIEVESPIVIKELKRGLSNILQYNDQRSQGVDLNE